MRSVGVFCEYRDFFFNNHKNYQANLASYMPNSMVNDLSFLHWHHKTSAFAAKFRSWTIPKIACAICTSDKILSDAAKATDSLKLKFPPPITAFQSFMISGFREAKIMMMENTHSTKQRVGSQKGSERLQDNVDMTSITNSSFVVNNCAYCKHRYVIPIGMDINEITRSIKMLRNLIVVE